MAKSQTFDSLGCGNKIPADLYQTGDFEAFYFMDEHYHGGNIPHFHNYYELMLLMRGKINIAVEGKRYNIPEGSIIITPPQLEHCTIVLEETKIYERIMLHWTPAFLRLLTQTNRMPENNCFDDVSIIACSSSDTAVYRLLMERLITEIHNTKPGDSFSLSIQECTISEIILRCARDISNADSKIPGDSSIVVSKIIEYINDHFQDPDLSLAEISRLFFVSSGNLSKLFRTYTGTTVYQYIIQKRLFFAQNLLADNLSVLETCMSCGFKDYTCFLKAFRQRFRCTPKEFQQKISDPASRTAFLL